MNRKVNNNTTRSTKLYCKTNSVFMSSKYSKNYEPYRLLLRLTDETSLRRNDKYVDLSNLSMYYTWKNTKRVIYKQYI